MKHLPILIFSLLVICTSCESTEKQDSLEKEANTTIQDSEPTGAVKEVSFLTPDSIRIVADVHEVDKTGSTILLFHQAGANAKGEYHSIIPKLTEAGFNVIAFDQRVGGQRFGSYNRTMAVIDNNKYGYCDAYPDLNSGLDYAINSGFTGKKIIWGSSYSAALVIQLANNRPEDVAGVLAFSPASGRPLEGCNPGQYFETLKVPLLVLRPASEMEHESVKQQFELAQQHGHQTYISENGIHGSSMLVESRTESETTATWIEVMTFLGAFLND